MQLDIRLECGCTPNKIFKNKSTYNAHLKTQKHNKWVINNDLKNYKKNTTEYDNTLTSYKLRMEQLIIDNNKLMNINKTKTETISFNIKNFAIINIILTIIHSYDYLD